MIDFLVYYIIGLLFLLVLGLFSKASDHATLSLLLLGWPITILIVIMWWTLDRFGWSFDFDRKPKHLTLFGYRTPCDNHTGIALRGFGFEIMFWKIRK